MPLLQVTNSQLATLQRMIREYESGAFNNRPRENARRMLPQTVDVEIGKGVVPAASSGGTPGSADCTIWNFTSSGGVSATTETQKVYNLSLDATASGNMLLWLRHKRSGNGIAIFEDCGTT